MTAAVGYCQREQLFLHQAHLHVSLSVAACSKLTILGLEGQESGPAVEG